MIPKFVVSHIDRLVHAQGIGAPGMPEVDFAQPAGEAALAGPDSVSWRIFRHPLALYIGGITAVLLELAEPRVRSGVWDHTTFRTDPLRRMRRTGLAAMVTVYAARSVSEEMIAGVGRMHARIEGTTPNGTAYRADDPELLRWVHATALFGFMEAYRRYVRPLSEVECDAFISEGVPAALLYGAKEPPGSEAELLSLFERTLPSLEPSEIIGEFLGIMCRLPVLPRPLNRIMVRAAVDLLPASARDALSLGKVRPLSAASVRILSFLGRQIEGLSLESTPCAQSCLRLGLPADHLCRR